MKGMFETRLFVFNYTVLSAMDFFLIHLETSFKVKIQLVHTCTFKGSLEDLLEKEILPPGSCLVTTHDCKNMTLEINI